MSTYSGDENYPDEITSGPVDDLEEDGTSEDDDDEVEDEEDEDEDEDDEE